MVLLEKDRYRKNTRNKVKHEGSYCTEVDSWWDCGDGTSMLSVPSQPQRHRHFDNIQGTSCAVVANPPILPRQKDTPELFWIIRMF